MPGLLIDVRANGKAEPQRRVGGIDFLDKYTHKIKRPRYNERRRRCRLQRVLGCHCRSLQRFICRQHLSEKRLQSLLRSVGFCRDLLGLAKRHSHATKQAGPECQDDTSRGSSVAL
jgi:hypothetical protein